jgi:hypothetical protein
MWVINHIDLIIIMIYLKVGFTPKDNMGIIIPFLVWDLNY